MVESYNCLRLDNGYVFQVEVYEEEKNKKYFEIGGKKYQPKVGKLAELISHKGKFEDSDTLNLWQVDVDDSKLSPSSTKDDIQKLGGVFMKRQYNFIKYLNDGCKVTDTELTKLTEDNIHIVAVIATTTPGKCLMMFTSNKNLQFRTMIYIFCRICFLTVH